MEKSKGERVMVRVLNTIRRSQISALPTVWTRCACALAFTVLGIGGPAYAVDLEVTYTQAIYKPLMEETAAAFEAANPDVRIHLRNLFATHEEHLQTTLRDVVSDETADVAFHGNHLVSVLVKRGVAQSLDSQVAQETDLASLGYSKSLLDAGRVGDHIYGLPWQISVPVIFYNANLVEEAGGDASNLPTSWEGIIDLAGRIEQLNKPNVMGGFFDYLTNGNWTFQALVNSAGGRMMNQADTEIGFNKSEGSLALQTIYDFGTRSGMVDMSQNQAVQAFGAGAIGVYPTYSSILGSLQKAAEGNFKVAVGQWPFPAADGKLPAGGRTIVIQTKDSEKIQAAWNYIKFMTGPEVQARIVKDTGAVPGNTLALKDPKYLGDYYTNNPAAAVGTKSPFGNWFKAVAHQKTAHGDVDHGFGDVDAWFVVAHARRQRISQPNVLSTIQRLSSALKPASVSIRRITSMTKS